MNLQQWLERDFFFSTRALRIRKVLGGGMRQAGMLAAAALYSLDHMVDRLAHDHTHAQMLAQGMGFSAPHL